MWEDRGRAQSDQGTDGLRNDQGNNAYYSDWVRQQRRREYAEVENFENRLRRYQQGEPVDSEQRRRDEYEIRQHQQQIQAYNNHDWHEDYRRQHHHQQQQANIDRARYQDYQRQQQPQQNRSVDRNQRGAQADFGQRGYGDREAERHLPRPHADFDRRQCGGQPRNLNHVQGGQMRNFGRGAQTITGSSSDDYSEDERRRRTRRQHRPNQRFRRIDEAEIRDADRRMEKWHLSFSGDARSRSLEDFLLKVRRLARMDRIADDVLMQRIHTVLRGEAYDWYLCYADEFQDWDHFEERIRYMYGNPNKDQGNRQKIYERKQNRNETFLSFKMEIERLNTLLSTPLDPQRIFEVIWDNMRPHYRSKLACKTVDNVRKLEYYAYRIDANDPIFRNSREGPTRNNAVHAIEVEQKEDESYSSESEAENVNAIGTKFDRNRKFKDQRSAGTNGKSQGSDARETPSSTPTHLCWNCRKNGHLWRNCPEEKTLFCYLCGAQGKTVATCENHSGEERRQGRDNSGN